MCLVKEIDSGISAAINVPKQLFTVNEEREPITESKPHSKGGFVAGSGIKVNFLFLWWIHLVLRWHKNWIMNLLNSLLNRLQLFNEEFRHSLILCIYIYMYACIFLQMSALSAWAFLEQAIICYYSLLQL